MTHDAAKSTVNHSDRGYPEVCNRCGFWWDEADLVLRRSSTATEWPCNACLNPSLSEKVTK